MMNRRLIAVMVGAVVAMVIGCGGVETATGAGGSAGSGGAATASSSGWPTSASATTAGATSTAVASTTGAGGTAGGGPSVLSIGELDCAGKITPIGPILGEAEDGNGLPIDENKALAAVRLIPPVYPWTATSWSYRLRKAGICAAVDHEALAFVGPAMMAPAVMPVGVEVVKILAAKLNFIGTTAEVTVTLNTPLVIHQGEVLWIAVKLFGVANARLCVESCDGEGPDPNSWFSMTNATATVDDCPVEGCHLQALSVSPDPATAIAYGNDNRRFNFAAAGHP